MPIGISNPFVDMFDVNRMSSMVSSHGDAVPPSELTKCQGTC